MFLRHDRLVVNGDVDLDQVALAFFLLLLRHLDFVDAGRTDDLQCNVHVDKPALIPFKGSIEITDNPEMFEVW